MPRSPAYALLCSLLCVFAYAAPAAVPLSPPASGSISAAQPSSTVPFIKEDPNEVLPPAAIMQPIRGSLGSNIIGPDNQPIDQQNPDLLAPPTTDQGTVGNAKWPFSLSHNRLQTGGWARQQNVAVLPMATAMAGVNMRLEAGAVRELHWHKTSEWAYVIKGHTQVTAINPDGQNFLATVGPGDLWYFPPGIPHSLQATNDSADGSEFLLVFDNGDFSEDSTFLLTDWLAHTPLSVLAKNFQVNQDALTKLPAQQLYIFPDAPPPSDAKAPANPLGQVSSPFTFAFSKVKATQYSGGTAKIVDTSSFKVSDTIAAAEVTVEPGAMRELHWHPTQDEWTFFLGGQGRVTLFASSGNSRTFNYQAGDVGYVPASFGHYVENIGNSTLHFLEIFNTDRFQDVSLSQWLALTPPELVKAHLQISDDTFNHFNKTKQVVVGPRSS
ncbi:oxalate decarboxylase [Cristinia sonorae]|uniref:Oxalate decarboxylase n=1 Tax=Cristinia sonorae TaxID=1940300 RepID=A0A8K0UNS6_9AGAR|nr:oxalate decarboxylase [Cristinia sonorae]